MWTPEPFEADDGSVPFNRFIEDREIALARKLLTQFKERRRRERGKPGQKRPAAE